MKHFIALLPALLAAAPAVAQQTVLVDQQASLAGAQIADAWFGSSAADDFEVTDPAGFLLEEIVFQGGYYVFSTVGVDDFEIRLSQRENDLPGAPITSWSNLQPARTFTGLYINGFHPVELYEYSFTLPVAEQLPAGEYVVEIFNNTPTTSDAWSWARAMPDTQGTIPGHYTSATAPGVIWAFGSGGGELAMTLLGVQPQGAPLLSVPGSCPGPTQVDIANMTPGGRVALAWSRNLANTTLTGGACAGLTVPLQSPTIAFVVTADAQGSVTIPVQLPQNACGAVHLIAADVSSCTTTNVVAL